MMTAVIGCEPEELHEGLRLAVEFHSASDEITLPLLRAGVSADSAARRAVVIPPKRS